MTSIPECTDSERLAAQSLLGCHMVQLTTDKALADAIRFYEQLGFVASHEGMKLHLERRSSD